MYICQICKKKPATIHLTDIHNNVKKEVHICETCATEKGFNLQGAANLPHLLGMAAKKVMNVPQLKHPVKQKDSKVADPDLVCPVCGMTWAQFGDRGRLGCPHDYQAFDSRLRVLVGNQISPHTSRGDVLHVGKRPGEKRQPDELELTIRNLEQRLRQAVAEENYEAAASLKADLDAHRKKKADALSN